ncbi:hypothetical protein Acr_24g0015410 [Actinidia rufa]|uniref:C2H2-type domain-containing protein n=1 Tax=Actinidia rufa TaxID=165716 RepID=A0A7J0GX76_9ERIC|nr:hypothetical protein Acr_24g0015410 [Actinidia rufa]
MDAGQEGNQQQQHVHNKDYNGFCNLCGKHIGDQHVVSHQKTHRDAKVKCKNPGCGRRFPNKAELSEHRDRTNH